MRRCGFNMLSLIILLTIVWGLFILVSVFLTVILFQDSIVERILRPASLVRAVVGLVTFLAWTYAWKRLAEFFLYNILLRRRRPL